VVAAMDELDLCNVKEGVSTQTLWENERYYPVGGWAEPFGDDPKRCFFIQPPPPLSFPFRPPWSLASNSALSLLLFHRDCPGRFQGEDGRAYMSTTGKVKVQPGWSAQPPLALPVRKMKNDCLGIVQMPDVPLPAHEEAVNEWSASPAHPRSMSLASRCRAPAGDWLYATAFMMANWQVCSSFPPPLLTAGCL
jgi:hypothetical protein